MRDPVIYRIRHAHHHRTGDQWCIYPLYDFTHCISDALENVSHSICTLEFENNRPLYDWVLGALKEAGVFKGPLPRQYEFARLNLTYTMTSKRKLLQLVEEKRVDGWDDPRMPTIAGIRRRGYTPKSIRLFCERIGVSKADSWIDMSVLEQALRDDLDVRAPRATAVL
jgi:glutaminyl-tRNA synthetase